MRDEQTARWRSGKSRRRLRRVFLVVDAKNQLANRLLVFASLIACAEEHDATVVNLGFSDYAALFPTTSGDLLCRYPPRRSLGLTHHRWRRRVRRTARRLVASAERGRLRRLTGRFVQVVRSGGETTIGKSTAEQARLVCHLDRPEHAARLHRRRLTVFSGPLFRDEPGMWKHREQVLAYFRPPPRCEAGISAAMSPARSRFDVLIGTHIRRRDYETFEGGRFYFSLDQYRGAMHRVTALFPGEDVGFWICSDEPVPPDAFPGVDVVPSIGGVLEDLYSLACCDYLMGPPSTFSGWASYYGDVPRYVIRDPMHTPTLDEFVVRGASQRR